MQNKDFWNSQVVLYNHVHPGPCHPNLASKPFYVESQVVLYNQGKLASLVPPALLHPVLFGVRLMRFPVSTLIIGVVFSPGLAAVAALLAIRGIRADFAPVVIASPAYVGSQAKGTRSVWDETAKARTAYDNKGRRDSWLSSDAPGLGWPGHSWPANVGRKRIARRTLYIESSIEFFYRVPADGPSRLAPIHSGENGSPFSPALTAVRVIRRRLPRFAAIPPSRRADLSPATLKEILEERASRSINRICPRGVKRKMSNYPLRPRTRMKTKHVDYCAAIKILK